MIKMNWDTLLSSDRFCASKYEETDFDARSEYQRDIDRIVFCSAFRRLQDKTQVMPMPQSDFVRSRLTHSIEVASIGRSLGNLVGKYVIDKEELDAITKDDFGNIVAAACLAHDIGNPPFGHTGEKAIGKFFNIFFQQNKDIANKLSTAERNDFLEFEGNAQGLRILSNDHPSNRPGGLRLTYATLGAFCKYPKGSVETDFNELGLQESDRKSQSKYGFFQEERIAFNTIANTLKLLPLSKAECDNSSWCRHPLSFLMEAADTLTYSIIDFEDGHKLGFITTQDAEDILYPIVERTTDSRCNKEDWRQIKDASERIGALRSKALNSMIYECFILFRDNYSKIISGSFDKELPDYIPSAADLDKIKKMSRNKYYNHSSVIDIELAGFEVLGGLLKLFTDCIIEFEQKGKIKDAQNIRILLKMSQQFSEPILSKEVSVYKKLLICTDFISRMTDGYAMKLFKKLKGIEL
jgi:dGTPase